jgi:putative tryptophan/tyrosine transport system substrate-binding protein
MRLGQSAVVATLSLTLLGAPMGVDGQPTLKMPRIGYLCAVTCGARPPIAGADPLPIDLFSRALEALGYVDGRNIKIEYFPPEQAEPEQRGRLAEELVRRQVNVIFVAGESATALAARNATSTIPIVIAVSGDPVGVGLVKSLARPGGNVTGVTYLREQVATKGLELLKEVVPRMSRVAVLVDPTDPAHPRMLKELEARARGLGVRLRPVETRAPTDFQAAFSAMVKDQVGGFVLLAGSNHLFHGSRIAYLALTNRLAAVSSFKEFAEVGGLLTYGPNARELLTRAAAFVDRILKGARPGDLPIEQPTTFELVINLKTAKTLGLTIPPTVLARADKVIQ